MIKFKLEEGIELPKFESALASGFDVVAHSIIKVYKGDKEVTGEKLDKVRQSFNDRGYIKLRPFERVLFGTGLTLADINTSLEIQVRPRSGVSLKRGLFVANSPGTIDADYRGEIGIILTNTSNVPVRINDGERLMQLVLAKHEVAEWEEVEVLPETDRGEGGFGHTGK